MHKKNVILITAVMIIVSFAAMPWEISAPASAGFFNTAKNPHHIIVSQGETVETMTVSWKGNAEGPSYVIVEDETGNKRTITANKKKTLKGTYFRYWANICDLKAKHQYTVHIGDSIHFALEVPADKNKTTFIYAGDIQGGYESWAQMCEEMPQADFLITGGDMVNSGSSGRQWNAFLENCGLFMSVPLMTTAGNHEGVSSNETYKAIFAMPQNGPDVEVLKESFYYFDRGVCRVIVLDSSFLTDERKAKLGEDWQFCEEAIESWLKRTLQSSDAVWNIVVSHHPPYGLHDFDTTAVQIRENWLPLMEKYGVDLVLSGHQHMYMRTNKIKGITYVMGNAGDRQSEFYMGYNEPLYAEAVDSASPNYQVVTADKNKLEIVSKTKKGLIIDKAVIRKSLYFHILEFFSGN